ncbi:hypothetical protein [Actinocorallia aurantiaca]|uniref:Apea-like HEPN domain-containing protein n=1 Tax=Actinocorallia aurantiaca TaxID=46204 RepID=A0ABP6GZ97_9ACTN
MNATPSTTQVDAISLEISNDRLAITVFSPKPPQADSDPSGTQLEMRVALAIHDTLAIQWCADLGVHWTADNCWVGELEVPTGESPRLLQVTQILGLDGRPAVLPQDVLFLEVPGEVVWKTKEPAEAERIRKVEARDRIYNRPLTVPDEDSRTNSFVVLLLVENFLSSREQRVPGIQILPLSGSAIGIDVIETLNACASQIGLAGGLDIDANLRLMSQRRPTALLHVPNVLADTPEAAIREVRRNVLPLLDLIALRRGAKPKALAGIVATKKRMQVVGSWIEGIGYTGNLASGFISGEDPTSLFQHWEKASSDARIRLWLSLYSDALADERWDYRFFRCFNLLEGIAQETLPANAPVIDDLGNPAFLNSGRPYTTQQARGKVFMLIKHVASRRSIALSSFAVNKAGTVWEESELWVAIRNAVAHRGSWEQPSGSAQSARDQRIKGAICNLGHDGSFRNGAVALTSRFRAATEAVLYSALGGNL